MSWIKDTMTRLETWVTATGPKYADKTENG